MRVLQQMTNTGLRETVLQAKIMKESAGGGGGLKEQHA